MIVIVMGICGCGKTTIGENVAKKLGWQFGDGDQYHPKENVEKMSQGTPLTDADRLPWLQTIYGVTRDWIEKGQNGVLTCSALKKKYRNILVNGSAEDIARSKQVVFAYLKGDPELITERMKRRKHFMPHQMVASQMGDLEEPTADETCVVLSIDSLPDEIVEGIVHYLETNS